MAHPAFRSLAHRQQPLPNAPWLMAMNWLDLAFLHWPVPAASLRPHLPAELELDEQSGTAWLGVVPFRMTGVRARWLPSLPGCGAFPELNVRTYARWRGIAGVWFFSLDAHSRFAVRAARATFRLPYFAANMLCTRTGNIVNYRSERTQRGAPAASLRARWWPVGGATIPAAGSLEHWLVARYALFTTARDGSIRVGHVHHEPWQLAPAQVEIAQGDMTQILSLELSQPPALVHAASPLAVAAWAPRA